MYKGKRMCFGEEFERGILRYSGYYYKNQRHGIGKLYDQKGELVYEGNWLFGRNDFSNLVPSDGMKDHSIHHLMEECNIENEYSCALEELNVTDFVALRSIQIGDRCFQGVNRFEVSTCVKLEQLRIGHHNFQIAESDESKGYCLIHDCAHLREIAIGSHSFRNSHGALELKSKEWYD